MVYGGHHEMLTGLQNVAYRFSNPDYPPLVPAAGALAFAFLGLGDLHRAVDMTAAAECLCSRGRRHGYRSRGERGASADAHGRGGRRGGICLVGFAVSDILGIEGYTDLLWAAAAAGAVIWGLVLPRSTQARRRCLDLRRRGQPDQERGAHHGPRRARPDRRAVPAH